MERCAFWRPPESKGFEFRELSSPCPSCQNFMPVPSFQEHSLHVDSCLQKEHAWFVEVHVKDSPPSLNQILHLQLKA